jgi:hypothetical protein
LVREIGDKLKVVGRTVLVCLVVDPALLRVCRVTPRQILRTGILKKFWIVSVRTARAA